MHISLTPALEGLVKSKVETGMYNNASEVVREALRGMQKNDEVYQIKLERLREELEKGEEDIENGRFYKGNISDLIKEFKKKVV